MRALCEQEELPAPGIFKGLTRLHTRALLARVLHQHFFCIGLGQDEVPAVLAPRDGRKLDDGESRPIAVHQTGLETEMRGGAQQVGVAAGLAGFAEQMAQLRAVCRHAVEPGEDQQADQPGVRLVGLLLLRRRTRVVRRNPAWPNRVHVPRPPPASPPKG